MHGDTSTTFVAALACFYLQIPVGHVETGLRTYNIYSPYPEEFNRQAGTERTMKKTYRRGVFTAVFFKSDTFW